MNTASCLGDEYQVTGCKIEATQPRVASLLQSPQGILCLCSPSYVFIINS